MVGPLSYLDIALIAVCFLSGLLAMYRGLTRELLSIMSWVVAGLAVVYMVLHQRKIAEDMAQQMGAPLPIAQIAIGAVVFLIVLVVVHLITARISDTILDSRVGMIDRMLGFLFGVARGFVLVLVPYMFYAEFIPNDKDQVAWVRNSQSLPLIRSTGKSVRAMLERYAPKSLTNPGSGEQQGHEKSGDVVRYALAREGGLHISVTVTRRVERAG